jgi:hypothetical protein
MNLTDWALVVAFFGWVVLAAIGAIITFLGGYRDR